MLLFSVLFIWLSSSVSAHNWLKAPISRNGGTDQQASKPCDGDTPLASPVIISPGSSIAVEWSTNHNGDHIMKVVHADDLAELESLPDGDPKLLVNQVFPNEVPTGTVQLPDTLVVGENYVMQYIWNNYRNCVDLLVMAGIPAGWTQATTDLEGNPLPDGGVAMYLSPNGMGLFDPSTGAVTCMEGWDAVLEPPGCVLAGLEKATTYPDGSPIEDGAVLYTTQDNWGTYDLLTAAVSCLPGFDPTWNKQGCVPSGFEAAVSDFEGKPLKPEEENKIFVIKDGYGTYNYDTKEVTCRPGFTKVAPPANSLAGAFPSCRHEWNSYTEVRTELKFQVGDGYSWPEGGNWTLNKILSIAQDSWENQTWVYDSPAVKDGVLSIWITYTDPVPADGFKAYSAHTILARLQRLVMDPTLDLRNEFAVNSVRSKNDTRYPDLGLDFADGYYMSAASGTPEIPEGQVIYRGWDMVLLGITSRARVSAAILISAILLVVAGVTYLKYDDIGMRLELVYANVSDEKLCYALLGLSALAFFFSVAALPSLVWAKEGGYTDGETYTFSLWKMCPPEGECVSMKDATDGLGFVTLQIVRLFVFLAFFSSAAAFACAATTVLEFGDDIKGAKYSVHALAICAMCSFVAMGLFPAYMDDVLDEFPSPDNSKPGIGQGLNALCWLSACFAYTVSRVNAGRYERGAAKATTMDQDPRMTSSGPVLDEQGNPVDAAGLAQVSQYAV